MNALLCCPPSYWWVICDMTRRSETSGVQPIRKYRLDYSSGRIYYSLDQIIVQCMLLLLLCYSLDQIIVKHLT